MKIFLRTAADFTIYYNAAAAYTVLTLTSS